MIFQYQALDSNGQEVSDFIDAPSENAAKQRIRQKGEYVVRIKRHDIVADDSTGRKRGRIGQLVDRVSMQLNLRVSSKNVGLFSRQLATLLKAGLPLPKALSDISEQVDSRNFKNVVVDIKEKLEEGTSFSNALQRHRKLFSDMYINMVRVGENLGSLDQVIERLAEVEEKNNILKSKIRAALWYPSFMFIFALCVVIFMMVSVIPSIAEMFVEQNKDLPLPTEIVIALSTFLARFWFLIPVLVILAIYMYRRYVQTDEGRRKVDELKLKMPLVNKLYRKVIVLRFTQNAGILLNNRVDIIRSFEIVEKIVGNVIIEEKVAEAKRMIREGSTVTQALRKVDFLPNLVMGMIAAGEASDNLDSMLINIGSVYETELDLTVTGLTSLIEPVIIIIMGIAIGTIVLSVMLPIMEMNLLL